MQPRMQILNESTGYKPARYLVGYQRLPAQGLSIVIARDAGLKQSHEGKDKLLRGVYPERSRRARNDTVENRSTLAPCSWRFPQADSRAIIAASWSQFLPESTASEIANAVVFLASDAASFITGQTLSVSGGYTMI